MTAEGIAPEVRRFIADSIRSVAQLDLLLLLRTDPARSWTTQSLVAELRVDATWLQEQLTTLCDQALLKCVEQGADMMYQYNPNSADLEKKVTAVAQAYLLHRVSVIEFIYSQPPRTIQAFADAFRLRKEPPHG